MAYILGFIFADGNIIKTKRGTWFWSIQITDKEILEKIKTIIDSDHVISKRKTIYNHKKIYRLQIGSKEMCSDLLLLGLTERKSKTILFPIVPLKYLPDFIRGYFDGDGGVWVGHRNKNKNTLIINTYFTSGSYNFLISLKEILSKYNINGGSIVKKQRGFDLKYSVKDSLILYEIMYNSKCSIFLNRKRERFEKYIKMRS